MGKRVSLIVLLLTARSLHAVAQEAPAPAVVPSAATAAPASVAAVVKPRKYAVLSLVGDAFRNRGRTYAVNTPIFDRAALLAANSVLEKVQPGGSYALLAPTAGLYAAQKTLIVDGKFQAPQELEAALAAQNATHLLLITKLLANSSVDLGDNNFVKMGKLEGLGFYQAGGRIWNSETKEMSWGFMAPYANFTVSLVDLSQSTVAAQKPVTASQLVTSIGVKGVVDPWFVHTQEQNLDMLKVLFQNNVAATVFKLIN